MRTAVQKVDAACNKYTDHEFVHASLLGVAGLLALIAFGGGMFGV